MAGAFSDAFFDKLRQFSLCCRRWHFLRKQGLYEARAALEEAGDQPLWGVLFLPWEGARDRQVSLSKNHVSILACLQE